MTADLQQLKTVSQINRERCIFQLKAALAVAEAGEMETVIIIATNETGDWLSWETVPMDSKFIGKLEVLKYRIIKKYEDE